MCRLQIISGKQAGQSKLVRHFPFSLGRSSNSDLVLADAGVWDEHCRLEYRPLEGCFLVPLSGIETRLELQPVENEVRLASGAEISLGAVTLRFSIADPVPRSLKIRASLAWLFLVAVVAAEAWLIYWLPR